MNGFIAIALKEIRLLLRDPGGLTLLFIMPAAFITVFSLALMGVMSSDQSGERFDVLLVDEDGNEAGRRIREALEETGTIRAVDRLGADVLTRELAEAEISSGRYTIAVIVPREATAAARFEAEATVEIVSDPALPPEIDMGVTGAVEAGMHALAVQRLTEIVDELAGGLDTMESTTSELEATIVELEDAITEMNGHISEATKLIPRPMRSRFKVEKIEEKQKLLEEGLARHHSIEHEPVHRPAPASGGLALERKLVAGVRESSPNSVQQNVPGWTIFALFWIVQTLALSIITERTSGAYRRILVAPVSRASYILGKAVPFFLINLVQAAFLFAIGIWILPLVGAPGLSIPDVPATILLTVAVSITAICMGLLMASLSRSAFMMASLSATVLIVMSALAGIMVPKFIMPSFMQRLSLTVPQGWALDGYLDVLVRGRDAVQILPAVGGLLAFAAVFFALALWRMRRVD